MKNKPLFLIVLAALAVAFVILKEPKKPNVEVQKRLEAEAVEAHMPQRYRTVPTVPGNYLSARFALANDDLEEASTFYAKAIMATGDETDKAFLIERALPAMVGSGDIDTALLMARQIDIQQKTATGQLAVLVQMVQGFKEKDEAAVERLLPFMQTDGFGRLLKPLIETWVLVGKKDFPAAMATLRRLEKEYPSLRPLVQMHMGFVNNYAGNNADTKSDYMQALKDNFSVRTTYIVGKFYERLGEKDQAMQLYKELADKMPGSPAVLALQRVAQGNLNKTSFIENPSDGVASALYDVATVLHQENSSRLAVLYAQLAHYLAPNDEFSILLLGDIMAMTAKSDQAEAYFKKVPKESDLYTLAQFRLSQLYDQQGKTDQAVAILQDLAHNPLLERQASMELGDLYRRKEDYAKAIPYYTNVIDKTEGTSSADWMIYYARGISYERVGDWDKAESDLQQALKLSPEQPEVLNYLAYSWADHGKNTDKALDMLRKALAGAPNDPYITDSVGWALYKTGRAAEAVSYLENAVQQLPEDPTINDHLGDVYHAVGRKLEAQFQWERALKNVKENENELRVSLMKKLGKDAAVPHDTAEKKTK